MKNILLLISLLCSLPVSAQQSDTVEHYLTYTGAICKPEESYYYRLAYKEEGLWKVKLFSIFTQTKEVDGYYETYKNDSFFVEQRMFYHYYPNGKIRQKVRYVNGLREGVLKGYDSTGRLIDSGFYKKGIPYKLRYKWSDNGSVVFKGVYDDAGSGIGEEWEYYDNGTLSSFGKTGQKGLKDSVWTYYYINGKISSQETYFKDSMIAIVCYNPDGTVSNDECKPVLPAVSTIDISQHLMDYLRYPAEAKDNNIQGTVTIKFTVKKNGVLSDFIVLGKRIGGGCDEEAVRVMKLMPKWKPGKMHNRPADIYYTQRVTFRLE
ncbi:MAG: TonB family protein [Chitinophagales bacterium]|nr:TonB family protein [Chitinophagales bacterium]